MDINGLVSNSAVSRQMMALDAPMSARENVKWQEYMSNTAHQREVKDLQAAGLNPVLSAGGSGASTPSGAHDTYEDIMNSKNLNTVLNAFSQQTASSGKAVSKVVNEGYQTVKDVAKTFAQALGFGKAANAAFAGYEALGKWVESHPETFDDTWKHHNLTADYSDPTTRKNEADYRAGKNNQIGQNISNFFGKIFGSNSAKANANKPNYSGHALGS